MRDCADTLAYPISVLFNKIIDSGSVPGAWKLAEIFPILKKDDPHDKSNYRPVSLLAKLAAYRVSPVSLLLLHSCLRDRSQRVRIKDVTSDVPVFSKGAPQGSVLGPLLFNMICSILLILLICSIMLMITEFILVIAILAICGKVRNQWRSRCLLRVVGLTLIS